MKLKKLSIIIALALLGSATLWAAPSKKGFHFLIDVGAKANFFELKEAVTEKKYPFTQCQIDVDLTGQYMFGEVVGLNLSLGGSFDVKTSNYEQIEFGNRYSLYSKVGPRVYLCSFIFFDASFVIGRTARFDTGAYYMTLGADASFGFELVRIPFFTFTLRPIFSYRRGSYADEFAGGLYCSISI